MHDFILIAEIMIFISFFLARTIISISLKVIFNDNAFFCCCCSLLTWNIFEIVAIDYSTFGVKFLLLSFSSFFPCWNVLKMKSLFLCSTPLTLMHILMIIHQFHPPQMLLSLELVHLLECFWMALHSFVFSWIAAGIQQTM